MTTRREQISLRVLAVLLMLFTILMTLPGCAVVQERMGGQVFGVSATLAGVTVSLNGTVPTADKAPAP